MALGKFRTSPQLGPGIEDVITAPAWYDGQQIDTPSYQLGQIHQASDGHEYIWVKASAAIAAAAAPGTVVTVTEPAFTAASGGAGGWNAPPAGVAINQFFHARRVAL